MNPPGVGSGLAQPANNVQRLPRHSASPRAGKGGSGATAGAAGGGGLVPGKLISFSKDGRAVLGLVTEPDGKSKFFVVDSRGHRSSLQPKAASLVLPGGGYTLDDLGRFSAAAAGADASLLEIAWAIAADDGGSAPTGGGGGGGQAAAAATGMAGAALSLQELSSLLYDADGALEQWTTYWLLHNDRVYFKQAGGKSGGLSFQARSAEAVKAVQQQLEEERRREEDRQAFVAAAGAARAAPWGSKPGWDQWVAGPHGARIKAIKEFVVKQQACGASALEVAKESLAALGCKLDPPSLAWGLLAELGAVRLHDPLPLLKAGVSLAFDEDVQAAAQALADSPPQDTDAATRRDLTHLAVFTVDDAGTTEVDDGLSVERLPDGGVRLWVHVADPTRWVEPGAAVDEEARSRSRTLYLPFGSVPMFPHCLAEGAFSLRAAGGGGACCALSFGATLDASGALSSCDVAPSLVSVTHRLTYAEADADIALGPGGCAHGDLQVLYEAARVRKAWRATRGAIDIDLPEAKMDVPFSDLSSPKPAITITRLSQWESAARVMVAEMMILAGEAAGDLGRRMSLPLPYRGQEAPQLPPPEALAALPDGPCRGHALRRCMTRSVMQAAPVHHASLALDAYVQVTSPIRRYPDMLAHWNIKAALRGHPLPFSAARLESMLSAAGDAAREIGRAEGEVVKYWAAEYMRQHISEPFDATVLGPLRPDSPLYVVSIERLGLETVAKLPWGAAPGERVAVAPVDADPSSGYYRLSVLGELDSAVRRARVAADEDEAAAAEAEVAAAVPAGAEPWEMAGAGAEVEAGAEGGRREAEEGEQQADAGGSSGGSESGEQQPAAAAAAKSAAAAAAAAAAGMLVAADMTAALSHQVAALVQG